MNQLSTALLAELEAEIERLDADDGTAPLSRAVAASAQVKTIKT